MASTTALKMVYAVKTLLRDPSFTDPRNSLPRVLLMLERAMFEVHSKLPGRSGVNASFATLVAATQNYTITETDPYSLEEFRLASSGQPIFPVSLGRWLTYQTANPTSSGDPIIVAFEEAASGAVTARFWPIPAKADTVEAVRSTMITTTFQGISSQDLSTVTFSFGPYGTKAVEAIAAAKCEPNHPEAKSWLAEAANWIQQESFRLASHQAGDGNLPSVI